jgi:antitoxin component YwqK of YwqJK toxin-antitoxin module
MKPIICLSLFVLSVSIPAAAQKIERAYDHAFRETKGAARIYAFIEKQDSLWHMKAYFIPEKSMAREATYKDDSCKIPHGVYSEFYANKQLKTTGRSLNGKQEGVWLRYHENGMLWDSAAYHNGQLTGIRLQWHANGYLSDSSNFAKDGSGVSFSWYDDGKPSGNGSYTTNSKKGGKWTLLQPDGKTRAIEEYVNDSMVSVQCFDEKGNRYTDKECAENEAEFKGGQTAWVKYLTNNLNPDVPQKNKAPNGMFTVAMQFIVNTDGKVTDIKPMTNFGFGMEKEAERILKNSPRWNPAFQHGRKVKAYRIQPITFMVSG